MGDKKKKNKKELLKFWIELLTPMVVSVITSFLTALYLLKK